MTKLIYTIWALLLSIFELPIFRTCFANAMEDEDCESLLSGPPLSSVFFNAGIYILIVNSTIFPRSLREPQMVFLTIYEFLATAFLLEFALACIWTPIDVLLLSTLPRNFCHVLRQIGIDDTVVSLITNKILMSIVTYIVAFTFFLLTLHVTDAVDYTIIWDDGVMSFAMHVKEKLQERIYRELPFLDESTKICRCKRRKGRSKNRSNSSREH
ncbi:uncharacterized protein LOC143182691 [Calliopsis andreniformis]|uniref:uncharacterized protein LOC143182691 n=1 Tax=Calliopsis andreniformis TaxID=337506 RepID=UPI003FCCEB0D